MISVHGTGASGEAPGQKCVRACCLVSARSLQSWATRLSANPDSFWLDDPQTTLRGLSPENQQGRPEQDEDVVDALRLRAKNPDPRVAGRWIGANIGKVEIEGDEDSFFSLGGVEYSCIGVTPKLLIEHGVDVVTTVSKQRFGVARKILVKLEPGGHPARLRRDRNDSLPRQICGVTDGCRYVLGTERRVLVEYAFWRFACSKVVEYH